MRNMTTAFIVIGAFFTTTSARAALDPETKKPYQLQVVLQIGSNRVFTPLFQEQLERDLANQLKAIFGDLARVEVTRTHPLFNEIKTKGLNAALENWDALSERTTHFVLLDYVDGGYRIQTRSHEGLTGQAGPPSPPTHTHQRDELARTIAERIESAFSPVGTVTAVGKSVLLKLKGGELGVPFDRWIKAGHVFAVSRIVEEGGRRKAQRLEWALLEVLEPPAAGDCRCKYWHRYQEDDLGETPGTFGFRALRLPTTPGPVKVQLLDDTTLAPLEGVRVRVQKPGAGKPVELITNRDGLAVTREVFDHLALVQVLSGDTVRARFPVVVMAGRTSVARVKIQPGGESLAPFETRRDAWLRRVYENARLSSDRARDLATQLHQSLDAALDAGRKSLPELDAEIKYLAAERDQLSRLAKEKNWRFDPRAGDQELAELRKQAKELGDFVQRVESVLKEAGGEKALGLVQLLERARLFEAEADFDHAIRLYEQVVQASPAEKKVKAHLDRLKEGWAIKGEKHKQAREFVYQSWPVLDVAGLGKNMDRAQEALAACKEAGDKLTPLKFLRVNAGHTANLQKQLDTLKRRESEDNRNKAKTLAAIGETLIRLHQDAAVWVWSEAQD